MSRFARAEMLLVEDNALDAELTARAELARQAGCYRLAIDRTPTP